MSDEEKIELSKILEQLETAKEKINDISFELYKFKNSANDIILVDNKIYKAEEYEDVVNSNVKLLNNINKTIEVIKSLIV